MKTRLYVAILVSLALLLASCGRDGQSGSGTGTPAQTYSATVMEMDIVRSADDEPMPVDGLPASGAEVTVR